ncbi:DUF6452 family protein [Flagellimonas allohymeniacidonis]|uniref:Lipoprotein n=1 Tax=Flagellimonas allohymeniacidonis TaxID=2517819 RepID=A0A4Q8QHV6_9FLAO|nr:DUF6452 family protein [Allomuricauda hymeniacidonis]TAI48243.1 hypothetical protein EW142_00055 [Allomuricauda hymeniacidonis]
MKKILPVLFITILFITIASCEKDDICVDADTPLLVIGFFDSADTTLSKTVPSLRIREVVLDTNINTIADRSSSLDSIAVPLRIDSSSTGFTFITESADDETSGAETGSIDSLTISYTTREAFISRACGFVANYDDLSVALSPNGANWIQDIRIVQTTIENSNNIHVKIFH